MVDCARRLLLSSIIGIFASDDSTAAPVMGTFLSLAFVEVFQWRPFKNPDDNIVGIVLAYSLVIFFVTALILKAGSEDDSDEEQDLLGTVLVVVLVAGPVSMFYSGIMGAKKLAKKKAKEAELALKKRKERKKAGTSVSVPSGALPSLKNIVGKLQKGADIFVETEDGRLEPMVIKEIDKKTHVVCMVPGPKTSGIVGPMYVTHAKAESYLEKHQFRFGGPSDLKALLDARGLGEFNSAVLG